MAKIMDLEFAEDWIKLAEIIEILEIYDLYEDGKKKLTNKR